MDAFFKYFYISTESAFLSLVNMNHVNFAILIHLLYLVHQRAVMLNIVAVNLTSEIIQFMLVCYYYSLLMIF